MYRVVLCAYQRDEVIGEWRKLRNEEFNDLTPHPILFG